MLKPVSWKDVQLRGGFWGTRQETNRSVTLPIEHKQCKKTGRIDAFRLDWRPGQPNQPHHFWDSDLAKWIEAVGYSLGTHPDAKLQKLCDGVIDIVAAAQQPSGYLNVYFTVVKPGEQFTNLRDMHELYCAGHLMEAAVAYYEGTGQRKLLDVMQRYVSYIGSVFGRGKGKKRGYCGHPEIELALMRMHRATGDDKCLELATFFVSERGRRPNYFEAEARARKEEPRRRSDVGLDYYQADKPIVEQTSLEGHAVRALYLMSGAVDVAAATGNAKLMAACKRLWRNVTQKRMYVTGGVGSARHMERFTFDYDLPNETAYAETCAAISLVLFAHRLLQVEPSAEYADVMERTLYNGVASGVSLAGDHFFYANPLTVAEDALTTKWENISAYRKEWLGCACCPPNIARLYAWMGQLIYSTTEDTLFVHLFASGRMKARLTAGELAVAQATRYPWDGEVELAVEVAPAGVSSIAVRRPRWCRRQRIWVNGSPARGKERQGYVYLTRRWQKGDRVRVAMEMPAQFVACNPRCRNNVAKIAVQRGPIVYCAEEVDNDETLLATRIDVSRKPVARYEPRLLGGVTTLNCRAAAALPVEDALYVPAEQVRHAARQLKMVPYCTWGNRKVGKMQVWFPAVGMEKNGSKK